MAPVHPSVAGANMSDSLRSEESELIIEPFAEGLINATRGAQLTARMWPVIGDIAGAVAPEHFDRVVRFQVGVPLDVPVEQNPYWGKLTGPPEVPDYLLQPRGPRPLASIAPDAHGSDAGRPRNGAPAISELRRAYQRVMGEWEELERAAGLLQRHHMGDGLEDADVPNRFLEAFGGLGNAPRGSLLIPVQPRPARGLVSDRWLAEELWKIRRVVLHDRLGRVAAHGLGYYDLTDPNDLGSKLRCHVKAVTDGRFPVGGRWLLGAPQKPDQPYIPRVQVHARRQRSTSLVMWEVDTGRTGARGESGGGRRTGYGWDVVFGRAMLRQEAPRHPSSPFARARGAASESAMSAMAIENRRIHNRDKLRSTKAPDSWVPWVLAYGRSVGIPPLRIVDTIDSVQPCRFDSLDEMQADALKSWDRREIRSTSHQWGMSARALLHRLMNGMCIHSPSIEMHDPPMNKGRIVWTFTWTGDPNNPRFEQDGIRYFQGDPLVNEQARMPDLEVYSTWMEVNSDPDERAPIFLTDDKEPPTVSRIVLKWPKDADEHSAEPSFEVVTLDNPGEDEDTHTAGPPAANQFTTQWAWAKWFVRQAILVSGQLDWHLGRGHIYVEHLAADLCAQLRGAKPGGRLSEEPQDHPFLAKLWPFIRSVDEINALGDLTLLTPRGVPAAASCLSYEAAMRRMRMMRASWHWKRDLTAMRPNRRPLTSADHLARWARSAWEACREWSEKEIRENEVSQLTGLCPPDGNECEGDDALDSDGSLRAGLVGALRTTQSAVVRDTAPKPPWWSGTGDPAEAATFASHDMVAVVPAYPCCLADWQKFAAHLVFTITFVHSWVGSAQLDDMGNVFVASMGHRWAKMPTGEAPEAAWREGGPPPAHAGFCVALAELIGRHGWGRMARSRHELEQGSLDSAQTSAYESEQTQVEKLYQFYQKHAQDLDRSHFDLDLLRSRVNI